MRKIVLTFAILLSVAFTVASAASGATKHRRAAQTNSPAYNAAASRASPQRRLRNWDNHPRVPAIKLNSARNRHAPLPAMISRSALVMRQQMWAEAGNNEALQMNATLHYPHVSAVCSQQ